MGAASKKSVNVGAAFGGALVTAINDANGCFASEAGFGLGLAAAEAGTNNFIGADTTGMAVGGGGGGASLVFHSSLKYFELFVYII